MELLLLMLIIYSPPGQWLFGTAPFDAALWWLIAPLALLPGLAEEGRKWRLRRRSRRLG